MNPSLRACGYAFGLGMLALGVIPQASGAQGKKTSHVEHGQKLFERVWQPGSDAEAGGDGLGPLFNERSCIACHNQGGIGGAGPNKNNVTLLTAVVPEIVADKDMFLVRLAGLHPGFANGTTLVLHRFSTDAIAYAAFRENLLGRDPPGANDPVRQSAGGRVIIHKESRGPIKIIEVDGVTLLQSQRNTTPLFGMGLIDSIPQATIEEVATIETKENPSVHGRFVGRFGWRGQLMTLNDFIRGACATELGLQVSTDAQADDPVVNVTWQPEPKKLDITDRQCDEMTSFVSRLPAPRRLQKSDHQEAVAVRSGEQLFKSVGCAVCHRPTLGDVKGIYSDLLVHALGSKLADPSPAPLSPPPAFLTPTINRYYGVDRVTFAKAPQVDTHTRLQGWKTPPLWGLRDSGPYLHDGRAETVEEAIAFHGGEAVDSVERYLALSTESQARLLAFLATLAAPDASSLPKLKETDNHVPAPAKRRKPRLATEFAGAPSWRGVR